MTKGSLYIPAESIPDFIDIALDSKNDTLRAIALKKLGELDAYRCPKCNAPPKETTMFSVSWAPAIPPTDTSGSGCYYQGTHRSYKCSTHSWYDLKYGLTDDAYWDSIKNELVLTGRKERWIEFNS